MAPITPDTRLTRSKALVHAHSERKEPLNDREDSFVSMSSLSPSTSIPLMAEREMGRGRALTSRRGFRTSKSQLVKSVFKTIWKVRFGMLVEKPGMSAEEMKRAQQEHQLRENAHLTFNNNNKAQPKTSK